jgi:hypothetical protein
VHIEAVTGSAEGVVLVAVAADDAGVGVQKREAGAVGIAGEDTALRCGTAIE